MKEWNRFVMSHLSEGLLIFFMISYAAYFSWFTINRHHNLYSARFDLGNMDQTVWNSAYGKLFTLTDPAGTENISRFAFHADFFLVLLAPFYLIHAGPETLLLIQSLVLALGAIPVYLLTEKVLKNKILAVLFASSYLLYPPMQRANIYEFHAVTLAPTLILSAFYFAYVKKYPWFFIFSFLAAATKEEIPLLIAGIGLYIFIKNRNKITGIFTIIVSIFWFILAIWVVIPHYRSGMHHFGVGFYSEYGENPGKIILGFFKQPIKILATLFSTSRLFYISQLLLPVGFLALLSPLILLMAIPEAGINLLSNNAAMQSIYYQYTSGITPYIFIAAIFGLKYLKSKIPKIEKILPYYLIFFTVIGVISLGPLPFSLAKDTESLKHPNPNAQLINQWEKRIPSGASVSVTNNIGSHFTQRKYVYSFPVNYNKADYTIILNEGFFETIPLREIERIISRLDADKNYSLLIKNDNFYIYKKIQ